MMPLLTIFGAGLLLRLWLIWLSPAIYGGDTILRLVYHDRILLAYQLPLFQALIYAVTWISRDPIWVRLMVSVMGALAGVFFYLLSRELLPSQAARVAAFLFVCNPYLLHFSIVPYQEMAMLLFLLAGVYFHWRGQVSAASTLIAIACFIRYEAWIVAAVCAVDLALQRRGSAGPVADARDGSLVGSPAGLLDNSPGSDRGGTVWGLKLSNLAAALLYLWAPVVWIAYWHGLSPSGTFVLTGSWSWARLYRLIAVSRAVASGMGWLLIPFFVLGLGVALSRAAGPPAELNPACHRRAVFLLLTAALFSAGILFSAHGVDPDPERWITFREGHLPLVVALLFVGLGVHQTILWGRRPVLVALLLMLALGGYSVVRAREWVQKSAGHPALAIDLQVARLIDPHLRRGEHVAVLAPPLPEAEIQKYLAQAKKIGGEAGLARAHEILRSLDAGPEDYQRLLAYTGADRRLLIRGAGVEAAAPEMIVVFSGTPWQELESIKPLLAQKYQPADVLQVNSHRAAVYRRRE